MKYVLFICLSFLLTACGTAVTDNLTVDETNQELSKPIAPATATPQPTPSVTSLNESTVTPNLLSPLVDAVIADLSSYLSVPAETIEVVTIEEVTWRDGSLGCPLPDMMYTMALVPGYKITLTANDSEYNYHTRKTDAFILCVKGHPIFPETP